MNRKQFLTMILAAGVARPLMAQESQADEAAAEAEAQADAAVAGKVKQAPRDPSKGAVTNLPIPRYVSLKGHEGNARRGPGLTHRIDWVFKASGMPLRITAEHEHWRRVEDNEGMGGWVHYSLLSGVRAVLVVQDQAEFHDKPDATSQVAFKAERNVIGKLLECNKDWCRISTDGDKGWIEKTALWGVDADEIVN
ncbi:MAG: SH3 domain-containing protein [Cypionkella sp.]